MRGFVTLLRKELRDNKATLAVAALLAVVVSWIVQRWALKFEDPFATSRWLMPAIAGVGLVVVASDLFAQDLETGRLATLALLPIPTRTLWIARIVFLSMAGVLLFGFAWVAQVVLVGAFGKPGAQAVIPAAFLDIGAGIALCAVVLTA